MLFGAAHRNFGRTCHNPEDNPGKVDGMLGNPAFNLVLRSLGPEEKEAGHFHWYISIVPRINKRAGFELGTGMYVNPSLPESCADALRNFAAF